MQVDDNAQTKGRPYKKGLPEIFSICNSTVLHIQLDISFLRNIAIVGLQLSLKT